MPLMSNIYLLPDLYIMYILANLVRTLRDYYRVNLWSMTIFSCELSCNILNELVVYIVLYQVDGAATEATAHDTATSNTILLSNIV